MAEFLMPSLGADMEEGTLVEWRVKPGDRVKRRDVIAVVETNKAAVEIEVYVDGVVEELRVQPGQTVAVGTVMAVIRTQADRRPAPFERPEPRPPKTEPPPVAADISPSAPSPAAASARRIKASPYARRLAAENDIDLKTLSPSGPEGSICAADVRQAIQKAARTAPERPAPQRQPQPPTAVAPGPEKTPGWKDPGGMRRAIATAMSRSNREIPHYYLQTKVDMSRTLSWLESENRTRSIQDRILPVVPLVKAVALSLQEVPELNGYWIDDRHQPQEAINIGFAISLRQGGLIAPAILGADLLGVDALMAALRDLIRRTRAGRLRGTEMTAATITVTNLGDLGVEAVFGVIYPPQVALVGIGKTMPQPWAESGLLGVRPVVTVTLAADHRATDGRQGAQFLDALNHRLQEPTKL
jgi:pyruvate dehydrogenase E2 component (dihydrolipoamide acetyltransferase)